MHKRRAVVFDIGGILEITPRTGWEKRWEPELGLEPGEIDRRLRETWRAGSVGHIDEAEVHAQLARGLGIELAVVARLMDDIWREYLGTPNRELIEYFGGLRTRCKTGIISNSFVGAREREHRAYGFGDLCEHIVYSHEVGVSKPDERIFHIACERLGVRAGEVVFLDDVQRNVDAAERLGMCGVLYRSNAQAIEEIERALQ